MSETMEKLFEARAQKWEELEGLMRELQEGLREIVDAKGDIKTPRDEFAMAALQALDIQAHVARPAAEHLAKSAYEIADAMMKARKETDVQS